MTKYEVTTKITNISDGLGQVGMPLKEALKFIPHEADANAIPIVEEVTEDGQILVSEEEEVLINSKVEQIIIQTITKWKRGHKKFVHVKIEVISIFELKTQKNNFYFMKVDEF